jgi:hypothetical protein
MINIVDASVLAVTKLRTRRVRTIVTIAISGLLFAALVAALVVFNGGLSSVNRFTKDGFGSRYIVSATPDFPLSGNWFQNKDLMARAQTIYDQMVADKKAAAKRLDITYDPTTEQAPTLDPDGVAAHAQLNFGSPAAQQALAEYAAAKPVRGIADLRRVSAPYHPIDFYTSSPLAPNDGTLTPMANGAEDFDPNDTPAPGPKLSDNLFQQGNFMLMPRQLTTPFMLPHSSWTAQSDHIPLVVPYAAATKLLGLSPLPSGASASQKLQRVQDLYTKADGVSLTACYRNSVSSEQIQSAVSTAADILKNKGNKDYQKPELIYGLPTADSCAAAPISADTRTKAEKAEQQKQDTFNAEFGQMITPDQQKIVFDIVGLVPDRRTAPSNSAAGILQDIVGSSLAGTIAVPQDLYNQLPSVARYNQLLHTAPKNSLFQPTDLNYVEFGSADAARQFITKDSCTTRSDGTCATDAKPFQLSAFGSNSIALKDLQRKFGLVFKVAGLAVVVIAIVIMTGTVGRMLADSRRETAVFRAIGAKRIDIAGVYGIYTLLLSVMVALASLAIGYATARVFDMHFWREATVQAQLAFGGASSHQTFHFVGYSKEIWLVAGVAVASGAVSMILPALRNVRRNPIKDMRDE